MVDQAGQDAVEVEPAADVAGHPAQGLGPVEEVGDLVLAAGDADDRADGVGDGRPSRSSSMGCGAAASSATMSRTPHGPSRPGMATASSVRSPGRIVRVTRSRGSATTGDRGRLAGRDGRAGAAAPRRGPGPARRSRAAGRAGAGSGTTPSVAVASGVSRSPRSSQMATRACIAGDRGSRRATRPRSSSRSSADEGQPGDEVEQVRGRRRWRSSAVRSGSRSGSATRSARGPAVRRSAAMAAGDRRRGRPSGDRADGRRGRWPACSAAARNRCRSPSR